MDAPIAAVDLTNDGMVVIMRRDRGYRVSVLYGGQQLRSTLVGTAEELGELLDRSMPGEVTLQCCLACGEYVAVGGWSDSSDPSYLVYRGDAGLNDDPEKMSYLPGFAPEEEEE